MWNFLVSGLSLGCTMVLYDGSPLRDVSLLWKLVDDLGITIFGTSAKYLDQLSVRCVRSLLSHGLIAIILYRNTIGLGKITTSVLCDTSTPLVLLLRLLSLTMYTSTFTRRCF